MDRKRKREKERVRKRENQIDVCNNKREKYTKKAEIFILEALEYSIQVDFETCSHRSQRRL